MRRAAVGPRTTTALSPASAPYPSTTANMPSAGPRSRRYASDRPSTAAASPTERARRGVKGNSSRYPLPIGCPSMHTKLWLYQVWRKASRPVFSRA
jgi:hypothetical protein